MLHLHNRVTEKIFYEVLKKGYSLRETNASKQAYIDAVTDTVNSAILGSEHSQTTWKVPMTENNNDISSKISLTDGQAKKLMANIDVLLAVIFSTFDDDTPEEWTDLYVEWEAVIGKFKELNQLIQSRTEFSEERIISFQDIADEFFYSYIKLTGQSGVTNYIHLIGAGHLSKYLGWYKNLYKYSQQSWEHNNHRACGIYHKHSQKGGHGAKEEAKSQILPIFRYNGRCWMWKTGRGDDFFNRINNNDT